MKKSELLQEIGDLEFQISILRKALSDVKRDLGEIGSDIEEVLIETEK